MLPHPNFNPLSPHGERRPSPPWTGLIGQFQSTLPTRGETRRTHRMWGARHNFNPLSPHGERRSKRQPGLSAGLFQSTLPTRGETGKGRRTHAAAGISIHSPHTGRDSAGSWKNWRRRNFNPLSPHGERPALAASAAALALISIHSPHTGRDQTKSGDLTTSLDFNPLSPHGERRRDGGRYAQAADDFNPLSPHGERQPGASGCISPVPFQSTLPTRGETREFRSLRLLI